MINNYYNLSLIPTFDDELINPTVLLDKSSILKLNKIKCQITDLEYKVISYNKDNLVSDLISSYGLCRSLIVNSNGKVVGFSPPKSISSDIFFINNPHRKSSCIKAEEFVEGTMINVFYNLDYDIWEIATRNIVGATSTFYKSSTSKSKTFREMFYEAANVCNLDITKLNKKLSYSFVLQHPKNRIVVSFNKPHLFLVGVYQINHNQNVTVNYYDVNNFKQYFDEMNTSVKFPTTYLLDTYADLIQEYASMNTSYDVVGVVIHNMLTGDRTKIRNPVYDQVRNLRGNQSKLQYQYLCLRREGKVKDFLKYYPENKNKLSIFKEQIHLFTDTLYFNYRMCYIKKEKPLIEFSEQYRTHMFNIHKHYITELREKKLYINNTFVQKYVNEIHPSLLMYHLNFNLRKKTIDMIKCEEGNIII